MVDSADLKLERENRASGREMVIVVDADPTQSGAIVDSLRNKGFNVIQIDNSVTAITEIDRHNPGLVLMDVHMPFCDGVRAAELVRVLSPETTVVLMSGVPDEAARTEVTTGLTVIEKPRSPDAARRLVASLVEARKSHRRGGRK